ncbi:Retrovirus-related Pol polyprotein from transposon 17.6, partial [Mucuna pruriens]
MDAYSSYNENRIHPQDKAKTTFIIGMRTFCYKVMPFGMKNVGATYQRLMDRIFKDVMGRDVEVYVDDMVIKSTIAGEYCNTLRRIFDIMEKHQLKLNLEKCLFESKLERGLRPILRSVIRHRQEKAKEHQGGVAIRRKDYSLVTCPILVD